MKKSKLTKDYAVRIMSRAACILKEMGKLEVSFKEFEKASKKKFFKDFQKVLRRYASKPIKFLDPDGETIIYVDLEAKRFVIKRIK